MQPSFILSRVVAVRLATSWLRPINETTPIATADWLLAVGCWDWEILTSNLCCLSPFKSSFYFPTPLYIFELCGVLINKVLQGFETILLLVGCLHLLPTHLLLLIDWLVSLIRLYMIPQSIMFRIHNLCVGRKNLLTHNVDVKTWRAGHFPVNPWTCSNKSTI
jgi:hypothetical protein